METKDVRAVLEAKALDLEEELERLSRPEDSAGGISFGKRVGDGTSIAVERLSQVAAHDRLTAMLGEVRRAGGKQAGGAGGGLGGGDAPRPPARGGALPRGPPPPGAPPWLGG